MPFSAPARDEGVAAPIDFDSRVFAIGASLELLFNHD